MKNSINFIGHSTTLIDMDSFRIMTDPNLARSAFGLPRFKKAVFDRREFEKLDMILISHPHKDHLNKPTLKKISKKIPIAAHWENIKHLESFGFEKVISYEHWQSREFSDKKIKVTMVPAKHKRTLPFNPHGISSGFIIETKEKSIYFAGDTAFSRELFEEIAEKFKIDILLMPIGAYYPRWLLKDCHANPSEALEAMKIIGAKKMIPVHWGSFLMSLDTPRKSMNVLKKKIKGTLLESKVSILENGETFYF